MGQHERTRRTEMELLLTNAFLRYATEVRTGRRPPGYVDPDWGIPATPFDAVSALIPGLREPASFPALLASLPPPVAEYRWLVDALRRYRGIAARAFNVPAAGMPSGRVDPLDSAAKAG